ncbi:MAG TPA: hypothetical protein VFY58_02425 [Nocardioides sp.]|nr:hypothetical protein [Nocardioides sp.]
MNLISKATNAIIHPVRTATTVAGQAVGVAATGARTTMRILDRAAGQVRGRSTTDWSTPEPAPTPDVTPPVKAPQKAAAKKTTPRKATAKKTTAKKAAPKKAEAKEAAPIKAPSARAATVAPALSLTEDEALAEDLRTPSGIPAADPGHNPDTAETDLHQPGTEPLMDPATVKAVKSEAEVLQRAADRDKG